MKKLVGTALLIALFAIPLQAQGRGGGGSGSTPSQKGAGWQTDQRNEKDAIAQFKAKLFRLDMEEWKKSSLAYLEYSATDTGMDLKEPYRIGGAEADRKAVTESAPGYTEENPRWKVTFQKKTPRTVVVTLTDVNKTTVDCSATEMLKAETGIIGVFQSDFELHCFARPLADGS